MSKSTTQSKKAPKKATKKAATSKAAAPKKEQRRFWLTYPPKLITRPIIWEMSRKFGIIFNVRQASVTEDIGILCLELEGVNTDLRAAVTWLEKQGVKVEPVEINVIES
ncbi:MAG: NIL domain-containing protein [Verrucomicrobiales bacterium]|nr:NIL domain-containing protein [Verrucomicrobiales bacterium]